MNKIKLLDELVEKIGQLQYDDDENRKAVVSTAELYAKKFFEKDKSYEKRITEVSFFPMIYPADERMERNCWEDGKSELRNIVLTMRKDIELDEDSSCGSVSEEINSTEIFIVHGHDDAMKLDVARTLEKLDYKPIILHEQPDKGRNILNKLIEESDNCGFAIILLSPDDYGYSKETDDSCKKMRARQNVILELGYFLGKLKTDRVVALYKDDPNFEIPSDFVGTLYKKYDASGSWRYELAKELKAAGYTIDANKLIE